jgi:hypothetical protein
MIARGFRPVVWVGAVGAAALGCYMLSLRVAAERADLTRLDHRIVATEQQIRSLNAELGTRGRLAQLEQWNDQVLALSAPNSAQFVDRAQLARLETRDGSALDGDAEVRMAAAGTADVPAPQPAAPAAASPAPQHAVAGPRALPAPAPPLQQAIVQRTSLAAASPPAPPRAVTVQPHRATPVRVAAAAPPHVRPGPAPKAAPHAATPAGARRAALLDDRTVRALGETARTERRRGTRD